MMRYFRVLITCCVVVFVMGCDKLPSNSVANTTFKLVNTDNLFQVAVPDFMSEGYNLSEEAVMQYQNLLKELYVVVIHEPTQDFVDSYQYLDMYNDSLSIIENYSQVQFESIQESLDITSDVVRKSVKINGLPARIIEFDAEVDDIDVPITYYYTFYQGTDNIYLMLSWTLKSRRTKYQEVMEKMAKSFRLMQRDK